MRKYIKHGSRSPPCTMRKYVFTQSGWQCVQFIQFTAVMRIPRSPSPPLCRLEVTIIHQMTPVTQFWFPISICPNSGSFSVRCTIHAIIDAHKWNVSHKIACFQHARIGVFQTPYTWLQLKNKLKTPFHQPVRLLQISRCFFAVVLALEYCVQSGLAHITSKKPTP